MIIEGSLSVKAALKGKKREVFEIMVDYKKKDRDTSYIINEAKRNNVKVSFYDREKINEIAVGKSHGGIIARVGNRSYESIEACFSDYSFVALLEGIEDPFNLGYAFRSLYSAGCTGVIINKRDYSSFENVILKSSAGAFDLINIFPTDDLAGSVEFAKNKGCKVLAAMRKDAIPYFEVDYTNDVLVAIGGEMRGLSRAVLDNVDQNIYIPYANDFRNALNASSAISAISYEVLRQRLYKMI